MVQRLDPREQWLRDQDLRIRAEQGDTAEGMIGRVRDAYSTNPNFAERLPGFQEQRVGDFRGLDGSVQYSGGPFDRGRAEDAIYNRQMRFAEPRMQQEESRLHQRLVSQGFNTNDDAYREQMRNLREQQGLMRADQADRAILGGGQEASAELARLLQARGQAQGERTQDFNARLQGGQFSQSEQARRLAEALQGINVSERDRGRMLNELNAFRTGQQVQLPNVQAQFSSPQLQGIDQMGAAQQGYQNQLGAWSAGQASNDAMIGGLMGLAGTALGGPLGGMLGTALGSQMGRGGR